MTCSVDRSPVSSIGLVVIGAWGINSNSICLETNRFYALKRRYYMLVSSAV